MSDLSFSAIDWSTILLTPLMVGTITLQAGGSDLAALDTRDKTWRSRMTSPPARPLASPHWPVGTERACNIVKLPMQELTVWKYVPTSVFWSNLMQDAPVMN